jgi:hypothetical protein
VGPETVERDHSDAEIEFLQAMQEYKRSSGRMFPTWSEVLEVLRRLGSSRDAEKASLSGSSGSPTTGPEAAAPAPGSTVLDVSAAVSIHGPAPATPGPGRGDLAHLRALAADVLGDHDAWFKTPNTQLGNRTPESLIGTDEQYKVHDLLSAIDLGLY